MHGSAITPSPIHSRRVARGADPGIGAVEGRAVVSMGWACAARAVQRGREKYASRRYHAGVRSLIIFALTCGVCTDVVAQAATGTITGRVSLARDSLGGMGGAAVAATVAIMGGTSAARTDADGRFALERVPAGTARVRVRLLGFRVLERDVVVPAGDTAHLDLVLLPEPRVLDPVRADARSPDAVQFETRPSVATVAITARAMAGIPKVGEPDVVRVVQLLPGVVSRNDFNTGLNVRGGEADQNLILLDGFPIYNPFHLGGLFSTFMDATVGGIQLMTGAYPARHGGRLSSVLDVRSADETSSGVNATIDVSAIGASAKLGGAVRNGRGMWSIAGRRTYADAATAAFTQNVFPYHFRDLHARAAYAFSSSLRIGMTAYAGADALDLDLAQFENDTLSPQARDGAWAFDWGNEVIGVSLAKELGSGATFEQRVSSSGFSTLLDVGDGSHQQRSAIRELRFAGSLTTRRARHDPSIGYELATYRTRYSSGAAQTGVSDFELRQQPTAAALWIEDLWRVGSRWLVEGGVRGELLSGGEWGALSPRVSVKFFAAPDLALTAAVGRMTQWTHSLAGDGPLRYFDLWIASDSFVPVTTAWHYVAGAERRMGDAGSVKVEGYAKRYDRVLEVNASDDPRRRGDEFLIGNGLSYGVDLLARLNPADRGLSGWIAYSYGLSWRSRNGQRWAPGHDRRHDLDVVAIWQGARYRFGARLGYATGTPYTPIIGQIARRVYDPSLDRWGTGEPRIWIESLGGTRNSARFPVTHRIDLDASREFHLRGAAVSPYVSVVNAYNAKNVFVYLYNYSTDTPTRRAISQFPILPSVGVRVVF